MAESKVPLVASMACSVFSSSGRATRAELIASQRELPDHVVRAMLGLHSDPAKDFLSQVSLCGQGVPPSVKQAFAGSFLGEPPSGSARSHVS